MAAAARIDRTPTHNDLEITRLVHRALFDVQDTGRYGDRKVFIASLWTMMLDIEAQIGGTLTEGATIEHFKAWLVRSRLLTCDGTEGGARLIVLYRADLVAAMSPALVAASETVTDGAMFHYALTVIVIVGAPWSLLDFRPAAYPRLNRSSESRLRSAPVSGDRLADKHRQARGCDMVAMVISQPARAVASPRWSSAR